MSEPIRPKPGQTHTLTVALYVGGAVGVVVPAEKRVYFQDGAWLPYVNPQELALWAFPVDRVCVN